jgi:WD40 repeat protein
MPNLTQPTEFDPVLGGQFQPPVNGVVLGGFAGIQQRYNSPNVEQRQAAILAASHWGQAGLDLILSALQDRSITIQKTAYQLLHQRPEPEIRQVLRNYEVYRLFEPLSVLTGHAGGITAVAVSRDGKTAVSSGRDCTLRVWDLTCNEVIWVIPYPTFVYAIAFNPDQKSFTSKAKNQVLATWSLRTGEAIELDQITTRSIASVTVLTSRHQTRKHLISGSQNTIKIWNLHTSEEVCILKGHTSLVTSVATTPNRKVLLSGSEDRTVRAWGIKPNPD